MITIGIEGPSFAGKSTLSKLMDNQLLLRGYKSMLFPCYMQSIDVAEKLSMPMDQFVTLEEEVRALKIFLQIESNRKKSIQEKSYLDFVILDRTVFTLLAHNYALEAMTKNNFYKTACSLISDQIANVIVPDIIIYVDTNQEELNRRYPLEEKTIFTNPEFNQLFKKFYYDQKEAVVPIKKYIEVRINNPDVLDSNVERCCQLVIDLKK